MRSRGVAGVACSEPACPSASAIESAVKRPPPPPAAGTAAATVARRLQHGVGSEGAAAARRLGRWWWCGRRWRWRRVHFLVQQVFGDAVEQVLHGTVRVVKGSLQRGDHLVLRKAHRDEVGDVLAVLGRGRLGSGFRLLRRWRRPINHHESNGKQHLSNAICARTQHVSGQFKTVCHGGAGAGEGSAEGVAAGAVGAAPSPALGFVIISTRNSFSHANLCSVKGSASTRPW